MNNSPQINASNKNFLLVLLPFVIFAVIVVSYNLHKPFNLDEADFASVAQILRDNPAYWSLNPENGLWHPPLYMYSLTAAFQIFGVSTAVARGLGFFFYIFTIIFVVLICKELYEPKEYRKMAAIAACLCLINPLSLQFALLLDIDGGILTLLMTVFCYFFIRFSKSGMNIKRAAILGCIFGVSMLAKYTTPPIFVPAIFVFYFLRRDYKKAFMHSFLVLVVGVVVFWSVWHTYCRILDISPLIPFRITFGTKWKMGGFAINEVKLMLIKSSMAYLWYWVSPAFVMLMALSVADRVWNYIKSKTVDNTDFLMILGIGIFLYYIYYFPRQSMMKYQTPLYPIFAVVISRFLYNILIKDRKVHKGEIIIASVFTVITFVYYIGCFPDMVLWLIRGKHVVSGFFKNNYEFFLHLYFLPFCFLPFLFLFLFEKKSFYYSLVLTLLMLTVSIQVAQNIKQMDGYTTANNWHNYGEGGQAEAIAYLNKKLPPDAIAIVRKDVGYYLTQYPDGEPKRRYIYNSFLRSPREQVIAKLNEHLNKNEIEYVQLDIYSAIQQSLEILSPYYYLDKRFGDFIIFKKK